jgi:hypothetical protein
VSHLELSCFALCPLLSGFSQTMVSVRDVRSGGFSEAGIGKRCLESALRFGEFCQYDLFRGNSAKLADEANLGQNPDSVEGNLWKHNIGCLSGTRFFPFGLNQ